ncbi:polymer-forming cytoskeletal protein [Deltaproteobacteria bacterium TL4]
MARCLCHLIHTLEVILFGIKEAPSVKGTIPTYIGRGMKIEGKLRCGGPIRIDGEVRGNVECSSEITIGPTAHIVANIYAHSIIVNGKVEGNLFSTEHMEVLEEGHIIGNVTNPPGLLIVHEGAVIEGQCFTEPLKRKTETLEPPVLKKLIESSAGSQTSPNDKSQALKQNIKEIRKSSY